MTIRQLKVAILCLPCLLLSSCTKNSSSISSAQKPIKLGFILATMNEERYVKDKEYFENYARSKGATVEFAACDNKVEIQTAKVEALLSKQIDALIIQPVNGNTASSMVQMAKRDQIPVIAYDRIITNADIDLYVTQNSFQVGALQAEAAVKATAGKGNYILLMGESGHSVADEITRGALSVLEKHPNIQIVVKQNHPGWSTALALATTENALTRYHNKIAAVLANNDGMALGAVQAIEEQKLTGKIFVAGADADLAAMKDIAHDRQSLTILKGIQPLAEAAVDSALALATEKIPASDSRLDNGFKSVPVVNTPVHSVTKENMDQIVILPGFHSHESIFGSPRT